MTEIEVTITLPISKRLQTKLQSMDMLYALKNSDLEALPSICMKEMLAAFVEDAYWQRLKAHGTHSNYSTDRLIKELLDTHEYEMNICNRN
jgi:G:T-mismatch repair DNA endonuclease (very short patch repair protein)